MRKTVVVLRIIILEQLRDHISPKMSWDSLHTQVSHKPAGLYVNPWPQMAMSGTGTPLLTTDTNIETSGAGDTAISITFGLIDNLVGMLSGRSSDLEDTQSD